MYKINAVQGKVKLLLSPNGRGIRLSSWKSTKGESAWNYNKGKVQAGLFTHQRNRRGVTS